MFRALSPNWKGDCAIVLALWDFLSSWLPQGCLSEASPSADGRRLLTPVAVEGYPPKVETRGHKFVVVSSTDPGLDLMQI